jgi:hypothetical protein
VILGRLKLLWIALVVLAAFVIFIQCIAEVGGGSNAVPQPRVTQGAPAQATPN